MLKVEEKMKSVGLKFTEADFWKSGEFLSHMRNIISAVLLQKNKKAALSIEVVNKEKDEHTAYTDNKKIWINAGHASFKQFGTLNEKFLFVKGLLAHELTHILYSDFGELKRMMGDYEDKKWYRSRPIATGAEHLRDDMEEMLDGGGIFTNPPYNIQKFMYIAKDLFNVLEDAFCEHMFFGNYNGALKTGLRFKVTTRRKNSLDMRETLEKEAKEEDCAEKTWSIFRSLCYRVCILDLEIEDFFKETKGYELFCSCKPFIDKFLAEKKALNRYYYMNEILVRGWPVIKEMVYQERRDGDNGSQQEQNDGEQQNQDAGGQQESGTNGNCPFGNDNDSESSFESFSGLEKLGIQGKGITSENPQKPVPFSEEELELKEKEIQELLKKMIQEKEMEEADAEEMEELQNFADEIDPQLKILRDKVSETDKIRYEEMMAPLRLISRNLQKQVLQVLKDKRNGGKLTGLYLGRKVNVRALPRNDGRVFYNNKIPTKEPTMSVCIMIDLSGSMSYDGKIENARNTALLIEDFCRNLKIPVCVLGHNADENSHRGETCIRVFCDYNNHDQKDKFRIARIKANWNNRDDVALAFMYGQLAKRSETLRIAMIVSDGKPNAHGMNIDLCKERMKKLKLDADRKGIITFAAAIDDDKDVIKEIYGDSFLDITVLEKLPKIFSGKLMQFLR